MDHVLKMENMTLEFSRLMSEYGLAGLELPHVGKGSTGARLSVADLTTRTKSLIQEVYAMDFELFGYEI